MEEESEKANTITYCLEVKQAIETLLSKMNVLFEEIEVFKGLSSSGPRFIIRSPESGLLIGPKGEHLRAFNHILRKIIYKKNGLARFTVDINNYREENLKKIRNQALALAEKVKNLNQNLEMEPMSSYERMVIHSLFSQDPEITTESIGEKDERRVVIKIKN
jgi:predicted RNA-binding protein Jag